MTQSTPQGQTLHATAVSFDGKAALIRGPSGSGKSGLGLQLIALGASLISDDRTQITQNDGGLMVHAPDHLCGLIEARGVGILAAPTVPRARLNLIVDLTKPEDKRLPQWHEDILMGCVVPVVRKTDAAHFPAAVMLYLKHGRIE
ncbi:HPr kinase/phosphorylase [Roseovarius sp. MMSF_3281]|uniref:HPr kinase/phosphorylase n=1 Tax=Roseovarius sp. MMSF_3281 TaxID=3046694 RepID=UPI00273ECC64|nr:HPr kinase/phosphatase C-terminal domain-containing protein [Roseovarius sp. MMSF_3281]